MLTEIGGAASRAEGGSGGLYEGAGVAEGAPFFRVVYIGEEIAGGELRVGKRVVGVADGEHEDAAIRGALVEFPLRVSEKECGHRALDALEDLFGQLSRVDFPPVCRSLGDGLKALASHPPEERICTLSEYAAHYEIGYEPVLGGPGGP